MENAFETPSTAKATSAVTETPPPERNIVATRTRLWRERPPIRQEGTRAPMLMESDHRSRPPARKGSLVWGARHRCRSAPTTGEFQWDTRPAPRKTRLGRRHPRPGSGRDI